MKLKTTIITMTALSIGVMTTSFVLAHGGATGIVKERMDAMTAISKANKTLGAMFKGEAAYDAAIVREAATIINGHGGEAMTKLFPEGSGGMPSEALASVWEDWETFEALAGDLTTYSQALADASENKRGGPRDGKAMMGAGQNMMGQGMMQNSQGMMGQGMMAGGKPDAAMLATMPPEAAYMHVTQTCSSCHTKFRMEKK